MRAACRCREETHQREKGIDNMTRDSQKLIIIFQEHLGILNKFVRAVSHTHKDGQGQPDKPEKRLSGRRKSTGQSPTAGVYCGDDVGPSTSNAQADEADGKKRLSLFRNVSILSCYFICFQKFCEICFLNRF